MSETAKKWADPWPILTLVLAGISGLLAVGNLKGDTTARLDRTERDVTELRTQYQSDHDAIVAMQEDVKHTAGAVDDIKRMLEKRGQ